MYANYSYICQLQCITESSTIINVRIYNFRISAAHESGLIQEWLRQHSEVNTCPGLEARAAMVRLSLENIAGLFIILGVGLLTALIILIVEYLYYKYTV